MSAVKATPARLPVLELLDPREQRLAVALGTMLAVLAGWVVLTQLRWPLWAAVGTFLTYLVIPGAIKWRSDLRRYGLTVTVLSILLVAQWFHTIEHIVQWVQNHVLNFTLRASSGLLSPANAEWVHFTWNWLVLGIVSWLIWRGMRNPFAWVLLIWATAHTLEHSYLMIQHLDVLSQLRGLGVTGITAQGLPGVLGQDGWLARSDATQGSFLCRIPLLTTATRLDVHFAWNVGEVVLLTLAAHTWLRSRATTPKAPESASRTGTDEPVRLPGTAS